MRAFAFTLERARWLLNECILKKYTGTQPLSQIGCGTPGVEIPNFVLWDVLARFQACTAHGRSSYCKR